MPRIVYFAVIITICILFASAIFLWLRERAKARALQLTVRSLQIDRHFLYNSLNSLSFRAMVESPALSGEIGELADLYRASLQVDTWITVGDAIQLLKQYTAIEEKLCGRLQVEYRIDENLLDYRVVGLLFQPAVENAIHAARQAELPETRVVIAFQDEGDALRFTVTNEGEMSDAEAHAALYSPDLHGLSLTRQRLRLAFGKKAAISLATQNGQVSCTMRIPKRR